MSALVPVRRQVRLALLTAAARRTLLGPLLGLVLLLAVVYASDPGPALPTATVTAVALFPLGAWAAAGHLAGTSRALRALLDAAGGPVRATAAELVPPVLWGLLAALGATVLNVLLVREPLPWSGRGLVLALHLACAAAGLALALLLDAAGTSRGAQVLVVTAATTASLLVPVLPPLGPVLAAWLDADRDPSPATAAWSVAGGLLLAGLLAGCALLRRRRG